MKQSKVSILSRTESKSLSIKKFNRQKAVQLKLEPINESKQVSEMRQMKLDFEQQGKKKKDREE